MNKVRCRHCKIYFNREDGIKVPLGYYCSMAHVIEAGQNKAKKARVKQAKKDLTIRKLEVKPIKMLEDEAQLSINRYVRLRDSHKGCVSCDKPATWNGQWHCSHFFPQGNNSAVRYNLWNMHKACSICNNHLSGNLLHYKPELINRIGQARFEQLEVTRYTPTKFSREYLQRIKKVFNKKSRLLQKRLDNNKAAA